MLVNRPLPPSRPTYVRLQARVGLEPGILRKLVESKGCPFQPTDELSEICHPHSYQKAVETYHQTITGNTHICHCSFDSPPCHRCGSVPIPSGSSVSHGDWNWDRLRRRNALSCIVQGERAEVTGRWSDLTIRDFQYRTLRHPEKKWNYVLRSLWNVTRDEAIPARSNLDRHGATERTVEQDLSQISNPDWRFLEWVVRNEI